MHRSVFRTMRCRVGIADDLMLLVEVIEAGSISAASRKTGIPKSRLSRRIEDLENNLGAHLLKRGPRNISVTEIGLTISKHGLKIRDELQAAKILAQDRHERPSGRLLVSCPIVLTELFLAEFATTFAVHYPDVQLTLDVSKGLFTPDINHYDIAIQPSQEGLPDSDIVCQKLALAPYVLVAAPTLVDPRNKKLVLSDIENIDAVGWGADGYSSRWKLYGIEGEAELDVRLRFSTNSLKVVHTAALQGLGLARLPIRLCKRDLEAGRLFLPLPDWTPRSVSIYAIYPSRRALTRAGRVFVSELLRYIDDRSEKSVPMVTTQD